MKDKNISYAEYNSVSRYYNLQEVGVYYRIPIEDIKEEYRNEFETCDGYTYIEALSLDEMAITSSNIEFVEFDCNESYEYLCSCIKNDFDNYLVFVRACTWNKSDGAKITPYFDRCFERNYDVSQYVSASSSDGKALRILEYSHDVPMGYDVYIVGLTDEEYERIKEDDFEEIKKFVEEVEATLIDVA